jgi:hypothetical protein
MCHFVCLSPNLSFRKGRKCPYHIVFPIPTLWRFTPHIVDSTNETCLLDIMIVLIYVWNMQEQETL